MKVVLITGLSGSGKSVALRVLEDQGYFCMDNLPPDFLGPVIEYMAMAGRQHVAVAIDMRSGERFNDLPLAISELATAGHEVNALFLDADDDTLATRYSETRRRHPASEWLGEGATLQECIAHEREALSIMDGISQHIDTSGLSPKQLREWIGDSLPSAGASLTVVFESFAFKKGTPLDADFMFDARCLPNPYYDKRLRPFSGKDPEIQSFFSQYAAVNEFVDDIEQLLRKWIPRFVREQRSYITVAVGCTGGQHRSVFVAESLNQRFLSDKPEPVQSVLVRHRSMVPVDRSNPPSHQADLPAPAPSAI